MVGRAWVYVLLLAILFGCAPRSRSKLFLPNLTIPLECATSIHLVGCDLSYNPPHRRTATVTYRKGCAQPAVVVK